MYLSIQDVIQETLMNVILAIITLGGAYATYFIRNAAESMKQKAKSIEDDNKRQLIETAIYRLHDVARLTVSKIEEKTAKVVRQEVKAGAKNKAELEALALDAYDEILKTLEPEYRNLLIENLGNVENYIMSLIEDELVKVKKTGINYGT